MSTPNSNSALAKLLNGREGKIESVFMSPEQRYMFEVFVSLGQERSLPKLMELLVAEGIKIHMVTLKRYSARFKWYDLAERTEQKIVEGMAAAALPAHQERIEKALKAINTLKDKFYTKVAAGEIEVELADFVTLIKTEALLLGDPTERHETVNTTKLEGQLVLTDRQLDAVLKLSAAKEFNMPPPEDVIEGEVASG